MGTLGVVSVMVGNKVKMKIVTGMDGQNASKLAERLKKAWPISAKKAYELALRVPFGPTASLVVLTEDEIVFEDGPESLPSLYRQTFDDPRFNPRWEHGTSDHVSVVRLPNR